jgi:hypothetical protein
MNKPDAQAFEEKLLTIDLVDGLRREQERLDLALADAGRMQELRTEIQAYYAQAGITVSDALIDQAIEERQAQRFAFKPPQLTALGHLFASAYVYRGYVATAAILLAVAGVTGWYADRRYAAYQAEQALAAYRSGLQQQLAEIDASTGAIATLPQTLPALESPLVPALPGWSAELQASYQQARLALDSASECQSLALPSDLTLDWSGEAGLAQCHAGLPAARTATARAQQLVGSHRELGTAVAAYDLLQQRLTATPALLEWKAVADTSAAAQAATAAGSNSQQFITAATAASAAVEQLSTSLPPHASATACLASAVTEASAADKGALDDLLATGAAFKQNTSIAGIGEWATLAANTCEFFNSALTLRIVNEPGADTGTWRFYNGNRNARSYYIIVDALSGGAPGNALFTSAENQQDYRQGRFGVRVSERVFERIRRDKEDDGIIRNPSIGEKPADSLQWQLDDGFEPSFIAEW